MEEEETSDGFDSHRSERVDGHEVHEAHELRQAPQLGLTKRGTSRCRPTTSKDLKAYSEGGAVHEGHGSVRLDLHLGQKGVHGGVARLGDKGQHLTHKDVKQLHSTNHEMKQSNHERHKQVKEIA